MLSEVYVKDLGIIGQAEVLFQSGMTVLTGETGAGKTMMTDAIGLLMGQKADSMLVRSGSSEAIVEGRFFDSDDQELVVRRIIPSNGRSRSYLNGRLVSSTELEAQLLGLVEIASQNSHQSLLSPTSQRLSLDLYANLDQSRRRQIIQKLADLDLELKKLGGNLELRTKEIELKKFELKQIQDAEPIQDQEEILLAQSEDVLANAQENKTACFVSVDYLTKDEGALDNLGKAVKSLEGKAFALELYNQLSQCLSQAQETASDLRHLAETLEDDPSQLEQIQLRKRQLAELKRRFGPSLEEVLVYKQNLQNRIEELESFDEKANILLAHISQAKQDLKQQEQQILQIRSLAAKQMKVKIQDQLQRLGMANCRFDIKIEGPAGDSVEFLFSANKGEDLLPLSKTASGGELARAMLGLNLVLHSSSSTTIFDEVDAGIGGKAALAVGQALSELSRSRQILVVTHLAQVAAFGDHHIVVQKTEQQNRSIAELKVLQPDDRVIELSRMLSGQPNSQTAHQHAKELLSQINKQKNLFT